MTEPLITVAELRAAIGLVLDAVERQFGASLRFDEDYYHHVPLAEATKGNANPELVMGSVVDDVDSVRELLARDPDDGVFIWHDADHLVGVLRAVARLDLPRP